MKPQTVFLVSIENVDTCSHRFCCETREKAEEMFEVVKQECIAELQELIEFAEYNESYHEDIEFLKTMKHGDVPPHCMEYPHIDEIEFIRG